MLRQSRYSSIFTDNSLRGIRTMGLKVSPDITWRSVSSPRWSWTHLNHGCGLSAPKVLEANYYYFFPQLLTFFFSRCRMWTSHICGEKWPCQHVCWDCDIAITAHEWRGSWQWRKASFLLLCHLQPYLAVSWQRKGGQRGNKLLALMERLRVWDILWTWGTHLSVLYFSLCS